MKTDDRVYAVWLSLRLGSRKNAASVLYSAFSTAREIYETDDYSRFAELSAASVKALSDRNLEKATAICEECEKKGIGILAPCDKEFPNKLKTIANPPSLLYYKGRPRDLNGECIIGMVGTRAMTDYGRDVTYAFAGSFAKSGALTVSGLASGIDATAHRGTLDAGGYTVAFLGTPIDKIYPAENRELYAEIESNGIIFSEYCPGCATNAGCFPARNRLIAGISSVLVVCEAGEHSGALITANDAVMQGKPVFAIPGPAGSVSNIGTNEMLRKGARIASRPYDVLSELELAYPSGIKAAHDAFTLGEASAPSAPTVRTSKKEKTKKALVKPENKEKKSPERAVSSTLEHLTQTERTVLDAIDGEKGSTADAIVSLSGLDITDVLSTLTLLEIYGIVSSAPGGKFLKAEQKHTKPCRA